jgi:hypothetical protein
MACGDHPGPLDPPRVDRLAQCHVEQVSTCLDEQSEVAHGGETCGQGLAGVECRFVGEVGRAVRQALDQAFLARAVAVEVDMRVDQPGEHELVAQVDDLCAWVTAGVQEAIAD